MEDNLKHTKRIIPINQIRRAQNARMKVNNKVIEKSEKSIKAIITKEVESDKVFVNIPAPTEIKELNIVVTHTPIGNEINMEEESEKKEDEINTDPPIDEISKSKPRKKRGRKNKKDTK